MTNLLGALRSAGAILAIVVVAMLGFSPTGSSAADYSVSYCRSADGTHGIPLMEWRGEVNRPGLDPAWEACGAGGPMAVDWSGNEVTRPTGSRSAWLLDAIPPLRIVSWRVRGEIHIAQVAAEARVTAIVGPIECASNCVRTLNDVSSGPIDESRVSWELFCAGPDGGQCLTGTARVQLSRINVTFRDSQPPVASVVEGSLAETSASGALAGRYVLRVAGTDAGAGARRLELRVDGATQAASVPQCDEPYTRQQPCPTNIDSSVMLDTNGIRDGRHAITAVLVDAAGGERTVWEGSRLVQNSPGVGPGSDGELRGGANGSPASDEAIVEAWWPATAKQSSKSKTVRRKCRHKRYAARRPVACKGRPASSKATVKFSRKRTSALAGRVRLPDGQPVAGATLTLTRAASAVSVPAVPLATVTTDATGRWSTRVPIAPGSGHVQIGYRTHERDTVQRTGSATLRVRSGTTMVVSKQSVRRGARVTFRGQVSGRSGKLDGIPISVQANPGRRWAALASVQTSKGGRWSVSYKVPRALRGRYRVRAIVKTSATYPYEGGKGPIRAFRVR